MKQLQSLGASAYSVGPMARSVVISLACQAEAAADDERRGLGAWAYPVAAEDCELSERSDEDTEAETTGSEAGQEPAVATAASEQQLLPHPGFLAGPGPAMPPQDL